MTNPIISIITTKVYKKFWLKMLVLAAIVMIFIMFYNKKYANSNKKEGFTQKDRFVAKYNGNVYDMFYAQIYDELHMPKKRIPFEIDTIIKTTQASETSRFLDVGSGTGNVVNELQDLGYDAYGVDKSEAMIEYSKTKFPNTNTKCGDIMNSMLYDRAVFSHILCLYHTIYGIENKLEFFRNCYFWLKAGGSLVIHLVDPKKFDIHIPAEKHPIYGSPQHAHKTRDTQTNVKFEGFDYKAQYIPDKKSNKSISFVETFTDNVTGNIRQNEQTLYMEEIEDIVTLARRAGFILQGQTNLEKTTDDKHQFLYFFERTL
jgi:SAM-dependent methyltransferase